MDAADRSALLNHQDPLSSNYPRPSINLNSNVLRNKHELLELVSKGSGPRISGRQNSADGPY